MKYKKTVILVALFAMLAIGMVSAYVSGYKLFTAVSHFNVQEAIEVQYWDGAAWQNLAVDGSTFDLGTANIKAGETNSFILRARNTAASGVLGLFLNIEPYSGISHDVTCITGQSEGLKYTKGTDQYWFEAPAGAGWKAITVTTTADGSIGTGTIEFDNTLTRNNPEASYDLTC